ncbi:MAG: lysophospholipid acyltransferase family protein [Deltaproteobacteria bacterium]|nr:lysophospholipid acyltransferase family protein [Deltaproteobacteria bacterium]
MLIYRLLYGLALAISHIPRPLGGFLGRLLGTGMYLLPLGRTAQVKESIRRSLNVLPPGTDPATLTRRIYAHFGRMLFEVPQILKLTRENLDRYVVFEGEEHYLRALAKGRGVLALTGHFGNWEVMSAAITLRFGNAAVVVRPMDFGPLDALIQLMRTRFGTEIIPKQRGMRRIIAALRQGRAVGILLDQNVDWYEGAFVKFLGRWACTNRGLAVLALKTGAPVVPTLSVRREDGRYRVVFGEEVRLIRSEDKIRDVEDNTALFSGIIESFIRRYPDHWFWFHRRWKTPNAWPLPRDFYLDE